MTEPITRTQAERKASKLISKRRFYIEMMWAIHNLVSHPLSQLVWLASIFGWIKPIGRFSGWLHDVTVPQHAPEEGRG